MSQFKQILQEYKESSVDFVVVYIAEAHPTDEWAFENNKYKIKQPKQLEERMSAAKMFAQDAQMECPILVDNMNDDANLAYGALPERLYIIHDGKIAYEGGRGPMLYNLEEMKEALVKVLQKMKNE